MYVSLRFHVDLTEFRGRPSGILLVIAIYVFANDLYWPLCDLDDNHSICDLWTCTSYMCTNQSPKRPRHSTCSVKKTIPLLVDLIVWCDLAFDPTLRMRRLYGLAVFIFQNFDLLIELCIFYRHIQAPSHDGAE